MILNEGYHSAEYILFPFGIIRPNLIIFKIEYRFFFIFKMIWIRCEVACAASQTELLFYEET